MPTVDFYKNLGYDFYQYEDEEELRGLTPGGFNGGDNSLNVKDFNDLELQATRDIIACYELNCIKRNHGIPFRAQILCQHCSNKRNNKARNLFLHFCNKRSRQPASTGNRNNSVIPVCRNSFFPFTPDIFRFVCKKLNHNNL